MSTLFFLCVLCGSNRIGICSAPLPCGIGVTSAALSELPDFNGAPGVCERIVDALEG